MMDRLPSDIRKELMDMVLPSSAPLEERKSAACTLVKASRSGVTHWSCAPQKHLFYVHVPLGRGYKGPGHHETDTSLVTPVV
eukprot:6262161-Amphidinium_carterae.3